MRGTVKHLCTLVIKVELILEVVDGNEHGRHIIAVMNDGFIVGQIPILSPGTISIHRSIGNVWYMYM